MAGATDTMWDAQAKNQNADAVSRLSQMVAGNDHLVTQPGLVQALFENNASPQQAQAINQFVGGLNAEQMVRTAGATGQKIKLSDEQQNTLDAMGIEYKSVLFNQQDAVSQLTAQMAASGVKPVLDSAGNIKTDASGNPLAQPIEKPKKKSGGRGFWGTIGHGIAAPFEAIGGGVSNVWHGRLPWEDTPNPLSPAHISPADVATGLQDAYQLGASYIQNPLKGPSLASTPEDYQNADLARQLGYNPDSILSMQAFRARGYYHRDTSNLASKWDNENPQGLYGWSGQQAVIEAETFAADPEKYRKQIIFNADLTPDQVAAKLDAVNSSQFHDLVLRVNGDRADLGTDVATAVGIDPVKHSTTFTVTSAGVNLAAQFAVDPIAFGAGVYRAKQIASTAVKGFTDAGGIVRILHPAEGASTTIAQRRVIAHLQDMVDQSNAIRTASDAGETVKAARLNQTLHASNPFAGLLGDFVGRDQIIGMKSEQEVAKLGKGELPFVTGKAAPIDTYTKAVDYLASKSALLRLQGGYAPVEFSVMPGAMSSYGFLKLKGTLTGWSAGRTAQKSEAAAAKFVADAKADPGRLQSLLDQKLLVRTLPADNDAIDALSGKVIAAENKASVARALYSRVASGLDETSATLRRMGDESRVTGKTDISANSAALSDKLHLGYATDRAKTELDAADAELASARRARDAAATAPVGEPGISITDAGRGLLQGNKLRYGTTEAPSTLVGKIASIYTLGSAQRARVFVTRFTNWLPRDTQVDLTSAASADTVRKIARTYLTSGDANMLSMRWVNGNIETRKTIVSGLKDQIAHAAGLTRTKAGRELIDKWKADQEAYAAFGREFTDVNGVAAAQWAGQLQTHFSLPNFGAVHKAAAKVGLYEGTMGRLLGSTPVEKLLMQWKLGALFTPVTAMRANLESWLNAHAEGMFKDGVQAKAILRDTGKLDGEDIARSRGMDKILSFAPLQGAGRVYRHVAQTGMDSDVARAIREMPDDLLHAYVHDQAAYHYAMSVDPAGVGEATEIARNGFRSVKAGYDNAAGFLKGIRTRKGYELTDEVDGVAGANLYAHNLALRVNKAPNVAQAVIQRIENPELSADHVVSALESGPAKNLMRQSLFGKIFIRQDGTQADAITAAEIKLGKEQWADQITEEFKQIVTGRNGVVQKKITNHITSKGEAPDADWILNNVKGFNRPQALLKPVFDATPTTEGVKGLVDGLLDVEGKGYQWLVERLIQRHSTTPLFAAAYGKAKVGLEDFKQGLIHESGLSEAAAERATATAAAEQAWHRIARMVDDPHLKSQMDVVGRSFFAFSRATTMMLRRWGSTFWRNPAQARRFQLSAEAAVHSGLVYKDQSTGDWMFHFPASGVAQEVLYHAMSHIPGLQGLAQFPVSDFTGRAASIIPGSDNPFQYQTNPIVSISGRSIASMFPEHRALFDEVDQKLNGSAGQGKGFFATLEPSLLKKITDPMANGRDSITTSAMVGSLYNLYAAGLVPKDGASPSEIETFFGRHRTQTKTQLYLRAVLGAFSPATIKTPENENGSSKADFAYAISGVQGLRDEYKSLLNDTGGDVARATAIWTALHPDLTVYTQSGSQSTTSRAVMPATDAALGWMNKHLDFINKYKSVAAFFIPEQSKGDPYSQGAYRAQLEEGLRQRKTPEEFLNGVRVASAASVYYQVEDQYKSDLAAAKAAGNTDLASAHRADWLAWSKQFKALHPTFATHTEGSAANVVEAQGKLSDLRSMVKNGDVPGGLGSTVSGMLQAYDGYREFVRAHPGGTNQAQADRSSALSMFQDYLTQVVAARPAVGDLYAGVFRVLDNQLETLN